MTGMVITAPWMTAEMVIEGDVDDEERNERVLWTYGTSVVKPVQELRIRRT